MVMLLRFSTTIRKLSWLVGSLYGSLYKRTSWFYFFAARNDGVQMLSHQHSTLVPPDLMKCKFLKLSCDLARVSTFWKLFRRRRQKKKLSAQLFPQLQSKRSFICVSYFCSHFSRTNILYLYHLFHTTFHGGFPNFCIAGSVIRRTLASAVLASAAWDGHLPSSSVRKRSTIPLPVKQR